MVRNILGVLLIEKNSMNKKLKILIAEDERAIAGALNLKLNHVGFDSSVAFNGREAMDNLQKEKYDLLISKTKPITSGKIDLLKDNELISECVGGVCPIR